MTLAQIGTSTSNPADGTAVGTPTGIATVVTGSGTSRTWRTADAWQANTGIDIIAGGATDAFRTNAFTGNASASFSAVFRTPTANPSAAANCLVARTGAGVGFRWQWSAAGVFQLFDAGSAIHVIATAGTMALNTRYQFQTTFTEASSTTGVITINVTDLSGTLVASYSVTNANLGSTTFTQFDLNPGGVATNYGWSEIQWDDGRTTLIPMWMASSSFTGTFAGTNTATGALTGAPAIGGATSGTNTAAGTYAGSPATGTATAGTNTASGTMNGAPATTQPSNGTNTATGTAAGTPALGGSFTGTNTTTGSYGSTAYTGSFTGTNTASGAYSGSPSTTGAIAGTTAGTGSISGKPNLTGSIAGSTSSSGTVTGTPSFTAATSGTNTTVGAYGTTSFTGTFAGTNTATSSPAGTPSIRTTIAGTLTIYGAYINAQVTPPDFAPVGTLATPQWAARVQTGRTTAIGASDITARLANSPWKTNDPAPHWKGSLK